MNPREKNGRSGLVKFQKQGKLTTEAKHCSEEYAIHEKETNLGDEDKQEKEAKRKILF